MPRAHLPKAIWISNEPSERLVRWVMRGTWLMLAATGLVMLANHLPA